MRTASTNFSNWLAWSPIIGLIIFGIVLEFLPKDVLCRVIEPGGSEYVCGLEYSHLIWRYAVRAFQAFYILVLALTLVVAVRKNLSISGWTGFALSLGWAIYVAYMLWLHRNDDSP